MKNQITYLFASLLFLIFSNIYSQTVRFDKLLENHINMPLHSKHMDIMDDFLNSVKSENQIFRNMQKQDFDSSSVVDSIITINSDGNELKYSFIYDSKGNMTLELGECWDGSQWLNHLRYTSTYDSNGNMTTKLLEKWGDSSRWWNYVRYTYTYDSNGNITTIFIEMHDGSRWMNYMRYTYTYDSNEDITTILMEMHDGSQWVNYLRGTYTYDSNENVSSILQVEWDGSQWVNYFRGTYTYDSNGNGSSVVQVEWDGSQWVNFNRETLTYDSNGNMSLHLYEMWDGSQWVNDYRIIFTYDSIGNMNYAKCEKWESGGWIVGDGEILFFDSFGRDYYYFSSEIIVYYGIFTELTESNEVINEFSLSQNYPNPFNPVTTIEYELLKSGNVEISVYDFNGKLIKTLISKNQQRGSHKVIWGGANYSGQKVASGFYIYSIKFENSISSRIMILVK